MNDNESKWKVSSTTDSVAVTDKHGCRAEFDDPDIARSAALAMLRGIDGDSILLEAYAVSAERQAKYGPPDECFEEMARLMGDYLDADMDDFDAAMAMVQLKVARLKTGSRSRDELVDVAGYARVAAEVGGLQSPEGDE